MRWNKQYGLPRRMMTVEGSVTYNGKPLNKRAKRQVGFVMQVRRRLLRQRPDTQCINCNDLCNSDERCRDALF